MLNQHLSSLFTLTFPLLTPLGEVLTILPLCKGWWLELGAISHFTDSLLFGCLFFFISTWCTFVVRAILFDHTIHHCACRDRSRFWLIHFGCSSREPDTKATPEREEEQVRTNSPVSPFNSKRILAFVKQSYHKQLFHLLSCIKNISGEDFRIHYCLYDPAHLVRWVCIPGCFDGRIFTHKHRISSESQGCYEKTQPWGTQIRGLLNS